MTEAEWLACDDTGLMWQQTAARSLAYPPRQPPSNKVPVSRRIGSLFAVACVRATPQAADRPFLPRVVAAVDRAADSDDWAEADQLHERSGKRCGRVRLESAEHYWELTALRLTDSSIAAYAIHVPLFLLKALDGASNVPELRRVHADALRDVIGNPFRGGRGKRRKKPTKRHPFPVLEAAHLTSTVVALAKVMYESRDFGAMPILADALQDVGCTNEDILNHCRGDGPHVRGCWVVDLVLGKE